MPASVESPPPTGAARQTQDQGLPQTGKKTSSGNAAAASAKPKRYSSQRQRVSQQMPVLPAEPVQEQMPAVMPEGYYEQMGKWIYANLICLKTFYKFLTKSMVFIR